MDEDFLCSQEGYIQGVSVCVQMLGCVLLFVTPWTVAHQVPLSMEFPRQEYSSGLPFPSPVSVSSALVFSLPGTVPDM